MHPRSRPNGYLRPSIVAEVGAAVLELQLWSRKAIQALISSCPPVSSTVLQNPVADTVECCCLRAGNRHNLVVQDLDNAAVSGAGIDAPFAIFDDLIDILAAESFCFGEADNCLTRKLA